MYTYAKAALSLDIIILLYIIPVLIVITFIGYVKNSNIEHLRKMHITILKGLIVAAILASFTYLGLSYSTAKIEQNYHKEVKTMVVKRTATNEGLFFNEHVYTDGTTTIATTNAEQIIQEGDTITYYYDINNNVVITTIDYKNVEN